MQGVPYVVCSAGMGHLHVAIVPAVLLHTVSDQLLRVLRVQSAVTGLTD